MGMELAQHLADNAGGFLVSCVGADAQFVHGEENAAVDGFEAVAGVGQGPRDDHAHGVIEVRSAHLFVNIHGLNQANFSHKASS